MENWMLSWGATILVGCGLVAYYSSTNKNKIQNTNRKSTEPSTVAEPAAAVKRKQPKSALRKDAKDVPPPQDTTASKVHEKSPSVSFTPDTALGQEEDEVDGDQADENWALRLDANKKGVTLNSAKPLKSKKQGSKKQAAADGQVATDPAPVAGAVSDMLEPTAAGPSTIRLVGEEKAKKSSPAKAIIEKESKKQRQNRKKQEEAKAQREADEQVRLKLLEQQRRTAREARGEPARNGSGLTNGMKNAWSAANGDTASTSTAPLLDTFEPPASSVTTAGLPNNSTIPENAPVAVPSEDKQLGLLTGQSTEWNEVSSKGKKNKKKTTTGPAMASNDGKDSSVNEATSAPEASFASTAMVVPKEGNKFASLSTKELITGKTRAASSSNGFAALEEATSFAPSAKGHPQDSDWAA